MGLPAGAAGTTVADRPDRQAGRERARAEKAARDQERDAALEAAARRTTAGTRPAENEDELDDPWAGRGRRDQG